MGRKLIVFALLLFCMAAVPAGAGEEGAATVPPAEVLAPLSQLDIRFERRDIQGDSIELTLPDAIRFTLENNPDIRIEKLGVPITEQDIARERAAFDPVIESKLSTGKSITQSSSLLDGAVEPERTNTAATVGLKEKMATGGTYGLSMTNQRQWSNSTNTTVNPEYDTALRLDVSQPLLRSFGVDANSAGIRKAENAVRMAEQVWREQIIAAVATAMNTYWEMTFTIMDLQVREVSLRQAQQLLDENGQRFKAGTVPQTDLLASEAAVAGRETDILQARAAIEAAEDQLKLLMSISSVRGDAAWALPISPKTAPQIEEVQADYALSIETAKALRPDYQRFLYDLKNRNIELKYRRNQLWPSLDLNLSGELAGLGPDTSESFGNATSTDYHSVQGAVVLQIPLGNRAPTSAFYRAKLEQAQTDLRFERLKQTIVVQLRDAIRRVKTARTEINATETLRNAEWKRLQAERQRNLAGRSTSSDVLTFQELFAQAQRRYIRALVDYNQALVDLHRYQGTLLEYVNVQVVL